MRECDRVKIACYAQLALSLFVEKKPTVKLDALFCDHIEFNITLAPDEFDRDGFLKSVKPDSEKKDEYRFICPSSLTDAEQHAHVAVELSGDDVEIRLLYTTGKAHVDVDEPGMLEDCGKWISQFFKTERIQARVDGSFDFNSQYVPVLPLPFPLMTDSDVLAGCTVMGMALFFPKDATLTTAIIQRTADNGTWVMATGPMILEKDKFDVLAAIGKFAGHAKRLVRKAEEAE